ncbi:hypothetical protein [Metabacillus bambusae]|uniref:Uncharacterized protein n=1 Tax=Metabacillus bambusae TaxID=2795218 RepID=A0ABS3MZ15_9BACI|nr:hypothetical protein [Metabacillus bambusae]MBO1511060.1 hypothetical protein [Metabacillus bambusae]
MENKALKAIQRILEDIGIGNLMEILGSKIPYSDLNTLLLEVFRKRTNDISPSELLKKYSMNRFVHPADIDPIWLRQLEIDLLMIARSSLYTPIQISPVSPLGSCSVVATADQNKVISALRGTEVVSDATNLLALHICDLIKKGKMNHDSDLIRFCTSHRHIRAQKFDKPGLVPHFNIFCMVSSGRDKGGYSFEKQAFLEHIDVYRKIFKTVFNTDITVKINASRGYNDSEGLIQKLSEHINEKSDVSLLKNKVVRDNLYYQGLHFTIIMKLNEQEINIGDGGIVDWSQKLLGNRKERMIISGIGLDMINFLLNREAY